MRIISKISCTHRLSSVRDYIGWWVGAAERSEAAGLEGRQQGQRGRRLTMAKPSAAYPSAPAAVFLLE